MKAAIQELEQPADRDRFQSGVPAHEPPVFADRELILTALAQLIDNALKYSLPGSPIEVDLTVKETAVVLTDAKPRVWSCRRPTASAFSSDSIARRELNICSERHGLGLSIVKTIAADHQGHVWAEGEPEYGTVFLALPSRGSRGALRVNP